MKSTTLLVAGLASLAAASPLQKRQSFLAGIVNQLPPSYIIHPLSIKPAEPKVRATATRKLIRYGPFKLPANTGAKKAESSHSHGAPTSTAGALDVLLGKTAMDPNGFTTMRILSDDSMCRNCTVLSGRMDIVYDNGTKLGISQGVYLHHVVTIDLDKKTKNYVSAPACRAAIPSEIKSAGGGLNAFIGGAVVSLVRLLLILKLMGVFRMSSLSTTQQVLLHACHSHH